MEKRAAFCAKVISRNMSILKNETMNIFVLEWTYNVTENGLNPYSLLYLLFSLVTGGG